MSLKVLCNFCQSDLTHSEGITKHLLQLTCCAAPHEGGYVLDVYIEPPLKETQHFCGFGCLKHWLEKRDNQV